MRDATPRPERIECLLTWRSGIARVRRQWDDFVYHTRYAYNATGFVELWRRGRKVIDWHGMGTAFNDQPAFGGKAPYLKIGVYKFGWKFPAGYDVTDSQVTYSELRVGDHSSSYAEVDTSPV